MDRQPPLILRASTWLRFLISVSGLYVVMAVAVFGLAASRQLESHGELTFSEGTMTHNFLKVRDGRPLYVDFNQPPFIATAYTPGYYEVVGLGARAGGLDVNGTVILARSISLASTFVSVLLVRSIAIAMGMSVLAAAVSVGLILTSYVFHPWAYTARPDAPALALSLVGLWIGARPGPRRHLILAAVLLVGSVLTKQSFVVAAVALALALICTRRFDRAALFAGSYAILLGAAFVVLEYGSDGWFIANALGGTAVPIQPANVPPLWVLYGICSLPLLTLAGIGWRQLPGDDLHVAAVRWYLIGTCGMSFLSVLKVGASTNYFIEMTCVLALVGGAGFDSVRRLTRRRLEIDKRPSFWPSVLRASAAAAFTVTMCVYWIASLAMTEAGSRERLDAAHVVRRVANASGPVLAERESLAVLRAGKEPFMADPLHLSVLELVGRWDPAPFHSMLETGSFDLVVLSQPAATTVQHQGFSWWPDGTLERIQRHYRFVENRYGHYVYEPIDRSALVVAEHADGLGALAP